MTEIPTVRGPVDSGDLGRVLMHEHVFVLSEEIRKNYPELWDEETRVADAIAKLNALRESGIDTIVDPTVIGLGRDIPRVQRINERADINIVVAPGSTPTTMCRYTCTSKVQGPCSTCRTRWSACSSKTSPKASPTRVRARRSSSAPSMRPA